MGAKYKTCRAGLMRRSSVTVAEMDVRNLARKAAAMNVPSTHILYLLERAKDHLAEQRASLFEHQTHCDCGAS